jgi:murein DD-endopeptidase MepM/ murein hydrolase activator NlpD
MTYVIRVTSRVFPNPYREANLSILYTSPQVGVTPSAGPQGTVFDQPGSGFTPNNVAILHFRKPDNTEYPAINQTTDNNGNFQHSYNSSTATLFGYYYYYAIDQATGNTSSTASFLIYPPSHALTVTSLNPASNVFVSVGPGDNFNQVYGYTPFSLSYPINTVVSLSAPAVATGNNFQYWLRDGLILSSNVSTSVTMEADHTVTAVYAAPVSPIAVTTAASDVTSHGVQLNGTLSSNGAANTYYYFEWGATPSYGNNTGATGPNYFPQATPVQYSLLGLSPGKTYHYQLVAWNGSNITRGGDVEFTTATDQASYEIACSSNPADGGLTQGSGTYNSAQPVTVIATPYSGRAFLCWTENGVQVSPNSNYSFTASRNRVLVAKFKQIRVTTPSIAGISIRRGESFNIQWQSSNYSGNIRIQIYKGGVSSEKKIADLTSMAPASGSFEFRPDCAFQEGSDYYVGISNVGEGPVWDFSDSPFSITAVPADNCVGLSFPIQGFTPYNYGVNSVFDHSMERAYCAPFGRVTDYSGETGSDRGSAVGEFPCGWIYGYRKNPVAGFTKAFGKYYTGGVDLYYDNHPGYDFATGAGTAVYATHRGKVIYPKSDRPFPGVANGKSFHAIGVLHADQSDAFDGYVSYYLHDQTYEGDAGMPAEGEMVEEGRWLGLTGNTSPVRVGPHLHYELHFFPSYQGFPTNLMNGRAVDPYGWRGNDEDPYEFHHNVPAGRAVSLWKQSNFPVAVNGSVLGPRSRLKSKSRSANEGAQGVQIEWVFDGCADSLDYFEIVREASDQTRATFAVSPDGCPYFNYIDSSISSAQIFTYYVKAVFQSSMSSGISAPSVVHLEPSSTARQIVYPSMSYTLPFEAATGGVYDVTLDQQQGNSLGSKLRGAHSPSLTNSLPILWELSDPDGKKYNVTSFSVGPILRTETSDHFMVVVPNEKSGTWNLSMVGTKQLSLEDSVVIDFAARPTSRAYLKSDRKSLDYGYTVKGETRLDSFVVTNIGNADLAIATLASSSPKITLVPSALVIAPSQSSTIHASFTPTDTGFFTCTITLIHNGASSPDLIEASSTVLPSGGAVVQQEVSARWNLVATSVVPTNQQKESLFPSSISEAFRYVPIHGYDVCDSLKPGEAYWLKFGSDQFVELIGRSMAAETIAVAKGWNLVGSISTPISVASITSDPPGLITSQFFGYAASYATSDTIYPGRGYWVNAAQPGMLIMSASTDSSSAPRGARILIIPSSEFPPPPPGDESNVANFPRQFLLEQNFPNPFNPATKIRFQLPIACRVQLRVYNPLGQLVAVLINERRGPGYYEVVWRASTNASGLYFCQIEAIDADNPAVVFSGFRKMLFIK